jgi:hypothetical protein
VVIHPPQPLATTQQRQTCLGHHLANARNTTLIGEHMPVEWADLEPALAAAMANVGIEIDRGPWVAALAASGYEVFDQPDGRPR